MAKVRGNDPTGYSYGDADALKDAARSLASAIDGQTATRAVAVSNAGREFRGYFSQVFVDNAGIASRSASKLSDALTSLVGFVEELREAAKQEDRRRADAQAWEARKREREENWLLGAGHDVATFFGGDDPKPPEPEPEPQLQADAVSVRGRTIPAGGGGGGGTSSAVPADLRSFASSTRGADDSLAGSVSTFRNALGDYESWCNTCWGTLHAQSLVTAVQDWLTDNGHDASWADTVAAQFEAADGGSGPATLSDASIAAALASAGVAVGRDDFTIGPFSAGVEHISAGEISALLESSAAPGAGRALELARFLAPDEPLRILEQGARSTARTFAIKYGLAAERGFTVHDLESFVDAVSRFDAEDLPFCALDGQGSVATVALTPDRAAVLATTSASRTADVSDERRK